MPINFAEKPATVINHTFLMAEGRWTLQGHWLVQPNGPLIPVAGKLMVVWQSETWFTLVGKIAPIQSQLPDDVTPPPSITLQYRGHIGVSEQQFTYMLQHSHLGQIEGQGWILPHSIVKRFWILGDADGRTGIEHFCCIDSNHYSWSSSLMAGHTLLSTLEAQLVQHK